MRHDTPMNDAADTPRPAGVSVHAFGRVDGTSAANHPGGSLPGTLLRLPWVALPALQTRRSLVGLPPARGRDGVASSVPENRRDDDAREHHLVVLGDSVADGVGIDHHRNTIAGRLACRMSERLERPVAWHVRGHSGSSARDVLTALDEADVAAELARADAVVISVGVNDVKALHSDEMWRSSLQRMLTRVTAMAGPAPVILVGIPPIDAFPALPDRLGAVLGERCIRLDAIADDVTRAFPTVHRLPLMESKMIRGKAFADDGIHPSPWLHKKLAKRADALLADS